MNEQKARAPSQPTLPLMKIVLQKWSNPLLFSFLHTGRSSPAQEHTLSHQTWSPGQKLRSRKDPPDGSESSQDLAGGTSTHQDGGYKQEGLPCDDQLSQIS